MTLATNSLTNELGDGAPDFPQGMPTVGGDPVVESGSNSDGEWLKFSDGYALLTAGKSTGGALATWTYPIALVNLNLRGQATPFTAADALIGATVRSFSGTSCNFVAYNSANNIQNVTVFLQVRGNWK